MMKKRGQLFGQPIMYVFYAIVAILVLIFGIRVAIQLKDKSDLMEETVFFSDVEEKFNKVYRDSYGSSISMKDLKVPSHILEICFTDFSQDKDLNNITIAKLRDLIDAAYDAGASDNVFIINKDMGDSSIEIEKSFDLEGNNSVLCDKLTDRELDMRLINMGQWIRAQHI
jgi:hypothetical protein